MAYASDMTAAQAKPATAMSAITDFDPVLSRLSGLVDRVSQANDKISGGRPQGVSDKASTAPTPQNIISMIQSHRQALVNLVDHLESEVHRLEAGLS